MSPRKRTTAALVPPSLDSVRFALSHRIGWRIELTTSRIHTNRDGMGRVSMRTLRERTFMRPTIRPIVPNSGEQCGQFIATTTLAHTRSQIKSSFRVKTKVELPVSRHTRARACFAERRSHRGDDPECRSFAASISLRGALPRRARLSAWKWGNRPERGFDDLEHLPFADK